LKEGERGREGGGVSSLYKNVINVLFFFFFVGFLAFERPDYLANPVNLVICVTSDQSVQSDGSIRIIREPFIFIRMNPVPIKSDDGLNGFHRSRSLL
jgi:hypothetical protein